MLVLLHNLVRTGGMLEYPYMPSVAGGQLWTELPLQLTWFLTFGYHLGYFWYSPIFLAGLLLIWPLRRCWRHGFNLALIPMTIWFVFTVSIQRSHDDWAWGPRFLLPLTPFLIVGISYALQPVVRVRVGRVAMLTVLFFSFVFQAAMTFDLHEIERAQLVKIYGLKAGDSSDALFEGWWTSPLAGRLRNLGLPVDGPADFRERWYAEETQALRMRSAQNLWWWRLAEKYPSQAVKTASVALGLGALLAGIACMGTAFWRSTRAVVRRRLITP